MWERLNQWLLTFIMKYLNVKDKKTEQQIQMIEYAVTCILNEIEKFLLLGFFFLCMGDVKAFLVCFFSLASLRIFMGGSHRKTIFGCFMQSFLSFGIIILLSKGVELENWMHYLIFIVSIICIWKYAPIIPPQRPRYSEFQCMRFKAMALTVLMMLNICCVVLPEGYRGCVQWSVLAQVLENSMVVLVHERREKRCLE